MERCPVYMGLDSPCKVHGLYTKYFYRWLCTTAVAMVFAFLSFLEWINTGCNAEGGFTLCVSLLFCIGVPGVFYKVLFNRTNAPKLKKKCMTYTISNRMLFRILFKKVDNGK